MIVAATVLLGLHLLLNFACELGFSGRAGVCILGVGKWKGVSLDHHYTVAGSYVA